MPTTSPTTRLLITLLGRPPCMMKCNPFLKARLGTL
jgi:hypothetical protein